MDDPVYVCCECEYIEIIFFMYSYAVLVNTRRFMIGTISIMDL